MAVGGGPLPRPRITLHSEAVILHNGEQCRVVLHRNGTVSVGCSDITIDALRYLVKEYNKKFPEQQEFIVLQRGPESEYPGR